VERAELPSQIAAYGSELDATPPKHKARRGDARVLVILSRMGATREETTDILERVGRRW
jgi:hypothetical protein